MAKSNFEPKPAGVRIFLKNVHPELAKWFKNEAERLGYSYKEFFEIILREYSGIK